MHVFVNTLDFYHSLFPAPARARAVELQCVGYHVFANNENKQALLDCCMAGVRDAHGHRARTSLELNQLYMWSAGTVNCTTDQPND